MPFRRNRWGGAAVTLHKGRIANSTTTRSFPATHNVHRVVDLLCAPLQVTQMYLDCDRADT
jgi:hypothetical protein